MKKLMVMAVAAALIAGITVNSVTAAANNTEERGYVSVTASSNKELAPDTAEISISVVTTDNKSMQKATVQNKEISDKVYTAMKSMINPENKDYVKTSNFRANPLYTYSGNKRNLDKYEVSNTIIIHTKSINKIGEMIDKAISLGATDVSNMSFSVSTYENECDALLTSAAKKTRAQADTLVKAAGSVVTGVKSINGTCSSQNANSRVMYNMMAKSNMYYSAAPEAAMGSSTPIEVGVVRIYANVNASFFVK